jgi:hypothetical protein
MKMYVLTNDSGEIIATMQDHPNQRSNITLVAPKASPGQKLHHVELPKELEGIKDPEKLHHGLTAHLRK